MTERKHKPESERGPRICVRVTELEYARILKMEHATGYSRAEILRRNTFNRVDLERPLYDREHADRIITELKRIGNNVNQIAHKMNSGLMTGWSQALSAIARQLVELRSIFSVNHAIR